MTETPQAQLEHCYCLVHGLGFVQATRDQGQLVRLLLSDTKPDGQEDPHLPSTIADFLQGRRNAPSLAATGTAFQQKVWQTLTRIPPGETRSYEQIALEAGLTRQHVRAVARAIASNPIGIFIPCHRVIGKDGSLTGYEWGLERKRWLLEQEALSRHTSTSSL